MLGQQATEIIALDELADHSFGLLRQISGPTL